MSRRVPKPIAFATLVCFCAGLAWMWPDTTPRPVDSDLPFGAEVAPLFEVNGIEDEGRARYAAVQLRQIKDGPEPWSDLWTWRRAFSAADSPELQREVVGLARQVGPDALLAVLAQALAAKSRLVRLDAARSIGLLPESRLKDGIALGLAAADSEIRSEVMDLIARVDVHLRPSLLRIGLEAPSKDVFKRSVEMLSDQPTPELFAVLIEGLRVATPDTRPTVDDAIDRLVQRRFINYDEASRWWAANRTEFDELMSRVQPE